LPGWKAERHEQYVHELAEVILTVVDILTTKWNESGSYLPRNPTDRAAKSGSLLVARVNTK